MLDSQENILGTINLLPTLLRKTNLAFIGNGNGKRASVLANENNGVDGDLKRISCFAWNHLINFSFF